MKYGYWNSSRTCHCSTIAGMQLGYRRRSSSAIVKQCNIAVLFILHVALLAIPIASAGDWPHWRGPKRNDIVAEASGYRDGKWLSDKPAWSPNVGIGCSSPIVAQGKLYVTGWASGKEVLRCLDAKTGKELWRQSYACPQYGRHSTGDKGIYAGPSSSPEFDAKTGMLYTLSIDGDLNCWNTKQKGQRVWGFNLYEKYGVKRRPNVGPRRRMLRDYGYTSSPLVHGTSLIVEVGAKAGNLIAYDKRTGKQLWTSQNKDEAGHSGGPVPMTVEGKPCVAILTIKNLVVVRLDAGNEGKTAATYKWTTDFANNIPTPAVSGNSIIVTTAYNHYETARVDVSLSGAKEVWRKKGFCSGVCSPIIHDGHVYWAWRGVHCVDFKTGKKLWVGGNVGTPGSCILTKDDRLIVWANNGDLSLVETAKRSPDKYRELARKRRLFRTDVWPHVVLADGRLHVKDRRGNLQCFNVK